MTKPGSEGSKGRDAMLFKGQAVRKQVLTKRRGH